MSGNILPKSDDQILHPQEWDTLHGTGARSFALFRHDRVALATHHSREGLEALQQVFEKLGVKCLGVRSRGRGQVIAPHYVKRKDK